jgi:hypothetical protein
MSEPRSLQEENARLKALLYAIIDVEKSTPENVPKSVVAGSLHDAVVRDNERLRAALEWALENRAQPDLTNWSDPPAGGNVVFNVGGCGCCSTEGRPPLDLAKTLVRAALPVLQKKWDESAPIGNVK